MMNCIHRNKLTEYNWCKVAGYYCTLSQQMTCDRKVIEKPHTNADRIRSMSDEELAEYLVYHNPYSTEQNCLKWLQQPAKECE